VNLTFHSLLEENNETCFPGKSWKFKISESDISIYQIIL